VAVLHRGTIAAEAGEFCYRWLSFAILPRIDLHLRRTRVIDVDTAAITAKGDHMNTAIEQTGTAQAATDKPKAGKKGSAGQKRAHVGPAKGKAAKKGQGHQESAKGREKCG
jgi:hypothetical protein